MPRKDYHPKVVHNLETNEVVYEELTDDEVAQRDKERAIALAEEEQPKPKSELEQLRELTESLMKRIAVLEQGKGK